MTDEEKILHSVVCMVAIDGQVDASELQFLNTACERLGISREVLKAAFVSAKQGKGRVYLPDDPTGKRRLFDFLVQAAAANGEVVAQERKILDAVAANIGIPATVVEQAISAGLRKAAKASAEKPSQEKPAQGKPLQEKSSQEHEKGDQLYNVVFRGKILPGPTLEKVKHNLSAMFKVKITDIERFFTGKPVVVKGNVSREAALQMQKAFEQAGAVCTIETIVPQQLPPSAPKMPKTPAPQPVQAPAVKAAPVSLAAQAKPVEMMTCPKCGAEQKKSPRCTACGIFIQYYVKKQGQKSGEEEVKDDFSVERGEVIGEVERTAVLVFILAGFIFVSAVVSVLRYGFAWWLWLDFFVAGILGILGLALRQFYSPTAAVLTCVFSVIYLFLTFFASGLLHLLYVGTLAYCGYRSISATFKLRGALADPRKKPSQASYLVEGALILGVVIVIGVIVYGVVSVKKKVETAVSDFTEMTQMTKDFWRTLPDHSEMIVGFDPFPVPPGKPVKLQVVTTVGDKNVKSVKQVQYLLTFREKGLGTYENMKLLESNEYQDLWEATIVVKVDEPFIRFQVLTNTTEGMIEFDGTKIPLKK